MSAEPTGGAAFARARRTVGALFPKRKRPGRSHGGFRATVAARTPVQGEAEGNFSLLGYMLQEVLHRRASPPQRTALGSVAQLWAVWREAMEDVRAGRNRAGWNQRLRDCNLDSYYRQGPKRRRRSPRRKKAHPLQPPQADAEGWF